MRYEVTRVDQDGSEMMTAEQLWDAFTGYYSPQLEASECIRLGQTVDEHARDIAEDCLAECIKVRGPGAIIINVDELAEAFAEVIGKYL